MASHTLNLPSAAAGSHRCTPAGRQGWRLASPVGRIRLSAIFAPVLLGLALTACGGSPGKEFVGYWHTRPTTGAPVDDESTTRIRKDGDTWLADGFTRWIPIH
jgi:hypothetical protein